MASFFGKLGRLLGKKRRRTASKAKLNIEQLEERCVMAGVLPINQAPTIAVIADQVLPRSQPSLILRVNAQDPDRDVLTYSATFGDQLAALDQHLQLSKNMDYFQGVRGAGEKYLYSAPTNTWYFILPNGELRQFNGSLSTSPFIVHVGSQVWANPALLHEAVAPVPQGQVSGDAEAYAMDQRLGLRLEGGSYHFNGHGANEKWIMAGNTAQWHYILPSGQVHAWNGSMVTSSLVASFDTRFYDTPALLHEAEPVKAEPVRLFISQTGSLVVDPPPGYSGSFNVTVVVSDGTLLATRTFRVTVPNSAPNLPELGDVKMPSNADLNIPLPTHDQDGDPLNYKIVVGAEDRAYALDQQLRLMLRGSYYQNQRGFDEKYIWSAARNAWYFILPTGTFHQWTGSIAGSPQVAAFDPSFHANPANLHEAPPPNNYPAVFANGQVQLVSAVWSGGNLRISTPAGYDGTFGVSVTALDGLTSTTRKFYVSETNTAPVLAQIADQATIIGSPIQIGLNAYDPDGDAVTLSVEVTADRRAWDLDQQLQLRLNGSYYENVRGFSEKYIYSDAKKQWHFILPNGELHAWTGTIAGSPLVTTLDTIYHNTPSLLHDPAPPAAVGVQGQISGTLLVLTPNAGYTGTFQVTVTADDGRAKTKRTFTGQVIGPPTISLNNTLQLGATLWGTISGGLLRASSAGNSAADLVYTIVAAPANGTLVLNGAILAAGSIFTQADLDGLRLNYYHNGNESNADSFIFNVRNNVGLTSSGVHYRIAKSATSRINTQTEVSAYVPFGNALGHIAQALQTSAGQGLAGLIDLGGSSLVADGSTRLAKLRLKPGANPILAVQKLQQVPGVQWASPNYIYKPLLTPNDPRFPQQYHHTLMRNPDAWDISLGDAAPSPAYDPIIVAVIDFGTAVARPGYPAGHPDLQPNIWINGDEAPNNGVDDDGNGFIDDRNGWNFFNNTNDPNPPVLTPQEGHGTHVSGIVAARINNNLGVVGTAGRTIVMPLTIGDSFGGTSLALTDAFLYAGNNGAKIINYSGTIDPNDPNFRFALSSVHGQGLLPFIAAGNSNLLNGAHLAVEEALFVSATDQINSRASFSDYGTGIDISAPGVDILSTFPRDGYGTISGTSMASPNAAGAAALIWALHPTWTRDQVATQLLGTADNIDAQNPLDIGLLGRGRVNSFRGLTGSAPAPTVRAIGLPTAETNFSTQTPITSFSLAVPQLLDAATVKMFNFELRADGADNVFGTADDIVAPLQNPPAGNNLRLSFDPNFFGYSVGTNFIPFTVSGMTQDTYQFRARSGGLRNPFSPTDPDLTVQARARNLDGNGDGTPGDDFVYTFVFGTGSIVGGGGGNRIGLENPRNETDDTATNLGTVTTAAPMSSLQAIIPHPDGQRDFDWFSVAMQRTGRLTVSLDNIISNGDIHFRLYRVVNNTLIELGQSTLLGRVRTQRTTIDVNGGERILIWVYGFNFAQGDYDLNLTLTP